MPQFNVQEAKSNLSYLLELVEQGEEVVVVRHGKPVARLVPIHQQSILGLGAGDPNYRAGLTDDEVFSPLTAEETAAFYEGRGVNLLDTHTLVWALHEPDRLSPAARRVAQEGDFAVSSASLWELIIKKGRANAPIADPLLWWKTYITRGGIRVLPIEPAHIEQLDTLPGPNWDPFDRILICQCIAEGFQLVTKDSLIRDHYQNHLPIVW